MRYKPAHINDAMDGSICCVVDISYAVGENVNQADKSTLSLRTASCNVVV